MGADYDMFTVEGGNKLYVEKRFKQHIEDCIHEHGHGGYSGTLKENNGRLNFTGLRFKNYDAASEYIYKNAEKWGDALVVEYRDANGSLVWLVGGCCSC